MRFCELGNLDVLASHVHPFRWHSVSCGTQSASCPNGQVHSRAGKSRGDVKRSTGAALTEREEGCAEQLARFFPQVITLRVPVQVTALRGGSMKLREAAVLEFGAADFAIFVSTLPLEFDDHVRLERNRKGCIADATVVAVQYHEGRKAVAVRFTEGPCDWVTKP
jgi:hypothetical protein